MITIAVLDYGCSSVDIIHNAPDLEDGMDYELYLSELGYNTANISFMVSEKADPLDADHYSVEEHDDGEHELKQMPQWLR